MNDPISCDCSSCPHSGSCEKQKLKEQLEDLKYETPTHEAPDQNEK